MMPGGSIRITAQNSIKIGSFIANISQFSNFQDGRCGHPGYFKLQIFTGCQGPESWHASLFQICQNW